MRPRLHLRFALAGWGLFVVSAIFFILASVRSDDPLGLVGALFFLVACFVFMLPLLVEVLRPEGER